VHRLEKAYGPFEPKPRLDPLDGLILTVLSQATNDKNSTHAFRRLKDRMPSWDRTLEASVEAIEEAIRPGGLAKNKARTIKGILSELSSRPEGLSLEHLGEMPLDDAMEELTELPGVGKKTAACVLMFDFGRPVMPVDTHVHRLSRRLGIVVNRASADQAHEALMQITPPEKVYRLHIWLIAHGRAICRSQRPRCSECVLKDLCPAKEIG